MSNNSRNLTKIGVFYDGNYFYHVSNYYNYIHDRKSRISISGLHSFIRQYIASRENTDFRHCQIVDAHYFRGRHSAKEMNPSTNQLYYERLFDSILMAEGVTTHYQPLRTHQGGYQERGIDVWLALEAYELTFFKKFNIVVIITSDGDYVPLLRKLNTLGSKVMVMHWDFEYTDDFGNAKTTRTSHDLLQEATYPVAMHELINSRPDDQMINDLFVPGQNGKVKFTPVVVDGNKEQSTILSLKNGYGFIKYPPNNLFFHYQSLIGSDFHDLMPGAPVQFKVQLNDEGENIATEVEILQNADFELEEN